ncbi:MAG: PrsW family intramembrane metalloprotease [Bacteroidetes bacterium]|nr:PrsW family intramembrane metalloprotease [Bacteroidota bacterium]
MEFIFIIIISFFISFTWIYYFKLIDLFETEKKYYIVVTFILGTLSPYIIFFLDDHVLHPLGVSNSGNAFLSFLYYTFGIGLVEEIVKCLPLLFMLAFFKKAINEPLDYIKYICISALGFAFGENILYAVMYGHHILVGRSILTVPAHMFFSTLFIYGVIEYKYYNKHIGHLFKYLLIGILAHGIYDFLLDFDVATIGIILNIIFFLLTVSAFSRILNNAINTSPFYTPKKVIDQEKVRKNLMFFYIPLLAIILYLTTTHKNTETALSVYFGLIFYKFTILFVLIVRLSRFTIVPQLVKKIPFEFPFYYKPTPDRNDLHLLFGLLTVRGESYNEAAIAHLYEEEIKVIPVSSQKKYLHKTHEGIIISKISVKETSLYILKLFLDESKTTFKHYILQAKTAGVSHTIEDDPIVSLNKSDKNDKEKLVFIEWVILKKK